MNKKRFMKKLVLNKQTISNLDGKSMDLLRGGVTYTCIETCMPRCDTDVTCLKCPTETFYQTCSIGDIC